MNQAIRVHKTGGPDVLTYEKIDRPRPGPGEILIRQTVIGLNFIDIYHRSGLYPFPLPFIPGTEAAGIVEEIGSDVIRWKKGDRVTYASGPGSYCEYRVMPAGRVIEIPDSINDEIAAASMVKGLTAEYLLRRTYKVKPGEIILFHAIAGGVGLIACQWAKSIGATVIGTVSNEDKAKLAKQHGCDHVILYREENFVDRVKDITNGKGVPVVYDSVGKDTFMESLDCLSPRGMMVSFGNASGPVDAFAPGTLSSRGSLYLTRPSLWHYTSNDAEYAAAAQDLFNMINSGAIKINIDQNYNLKDAQQAHCDLEERKTTGSSILLVK